MAPVTTAPAQSVRRRVTDVVRVVEGTGLAVTTSRDVGLACLHVYTRSGTLQVTVPLDAFVSAARGHADANGHPFPPLGERPALRGWALLQADAEATRARHAAGRQSDGATERQRPEGGGQESGVRGQKPADGEREPAAPAVEVALSELATLPKISPGQKGRRDPARWVLIERAWRLYLSHPALKVAQIAAQLGVSYDQVYVWFSTLRKRPGAPVLRTNGRLVAS